MMNREIGKRLAEGRNALKLTQEGFSERSGVPLSTLKKYEGSHSEPGAEALAKMCNAGIDVNWVLTGQGNTLYSPGTSGHLGAEEQVIYGGASSVDPILLQKVMDFFFRWIEDNKGRIRIDQGRYGAIIAVLYRVAASRGECVKADLEQVLSIAA